MELLFTNHHKRHYYIKSLPLGGSPMLITSEYVSDGGGLLEIESWTYSESN